MKEQLEKYHASITIFITIGLITALVFLPPISQDVRYHDFADAKSIWEIPNFMNVLSNLPFLFIGSLGLFKILKNHDSEFPKKAILVFFIGIILTGFGSAYYHLNPNNSTLLWDRLPMTIAFMSLFSAIIALHMESWAGKMVLLPFLVVGLLSVVYWYVTELNGHGDLRPYIFIQFYPMLFIPLIMFLYPVKGAALKILLPMIGSYAIAKYLEHNDDAFYIMNGIISGHTLKHLFAAAATVPVLFIEKVYLKN